MRQGGRVVNGLAAFPGDSLFGYRAKFRVRLRVSYRGSLPAGCTLQDLLDSWPPGLSRDYTLPIYDGQKSIDVKSYRL